MALSVRCYTSSRSAPPQALRCAPGAARARGARAVPQLRAAAVSLSFSLPLSARSRVPAASRGLRLSLVARAAATGTLSAADDDDDDGGLPAQYVTPPHQRLDDEHVTTLDNPINLPGCTTGWEAHFEELVAYAEAHNGSTEVPQDSTLGQWVKRQRFLYARGELPAERQALLDSIGFVWNVYDEQWQKRYDALVAFKQANGGSVLVPTRVGGVANPLGRWLSEQRKRWRLGSLAAEHVAKLEALGVRP
jgi:hypothetical protein